MTYKEIKKITNDPIEILNLFFYDANKETFERILTIIKENSFLNKFINDLYFFQPLTSPISKNGWKEKRISDQKTNNAHRNEKLVALNSYDKNTKQFIQLHPRIFVYPQYFIDNRKGSFPEIYVREGILESILEHLVLLPEEFGIMVYDGFRTFECQKDIYDEIYEQKLSEEMKKTENNEKNSSEIEEYVKSVIMPNYVSYPSFEPPSTHNTGGAIDFRICNKNGQVLNYGCEFDEFESVANLTFFEEKLKRKIHLSNEELESLLIRRVSTNLWKYPTENLTYHYIGRKKYNNFIEFAGEDWHFDLNNQWDTDLDEALYGSCEKDKIIPNPNYTVKDYIRERKIILKTNGS